MSDDPKEPEGQGAESTQSNEEEGPKLRQVSEDKLKEILAKHEKWLESDGKEGEQADLQSVDLREALLIGANLREADLSSANLQKANLAKANLQEAELIKTNLREANLHGANLQKAALIRADLHGTHLFRANLQGAGLQHANLQEANLGFANLQGAGLTDANLRRAMFGHATLREANLQDADLTDVKGLLAEQLAGTNVSGAKLPEDIATFGGLDQVVEISRIARKLFLPMLLGALYAVLTIATTQDVWLITNLATSPLPVIGAKIPIVGFYMTAPFLLIGIYVYFHLYMHRLWVGLSGLPAIFPDGTPLDKKAYPWVVIGFVRAHMAPLTNRRQPLALTEIWISVLLAWWVIPATIMYFWVRYLPRHDWAGTALHIALLAASLGIALMLQDLAGATLRGRPWQPIVWNSAYKDGRVYKRFAVLSVMTIVISLLSFNAIQGVPERSLMLTADLRKADLEKVNLAGRDLKGADLRFANLQEADLSRADFQGAKLQGAALFRANLKGANLSFADLRYAEGLTLVQLGGACGDMNTKLPKDLKQYKMNPCPEAGN